ncbi:cysteine desulfurase family protein [Sphingomonas canadensis]|uniref:Cysteine desulfurase n=1 Tax=Sphingomonas canadensis TaxID=1219257 RepID=A0ABW3H3R8_9SPHN|nr:aminotransferase class V-fold PLP-dependent enzyme [Sphingomonas canadensis]MCW3835579.1 aminotransferase class V-fold PLP-dependent enzyme [Sphingomonas canadensis]
MSRIYLDHAATTPMRPEAIAAVEQGMRRWANPSSPHAEGRAARAALEDARARIKAALGWDGELIFTSGASEAIWIALNRSKAARRLVSAVEHDAVFAAAPGADVLPIDDWAPDAGFLADWLARGDGVPLVAIQSVNSETGNILLFDETRTVREVGGLMLCDASQSAGKMPLPDADLIVVSAHKLGGPPGIGALLVRDLATLEPAGGHEFGYRRGTENLPSALGFAAALEAGGVESWGTSAEQRLDFRNALFAHGEHLGGGMLCSHIFAATMPMPAAAQLIRFDAMGFAVSAGSACSSGTLKPSRALAAFGVPAGEAAKAIRISIGWSTTPSDLEAFLDARASIMEGAA